MKWISADQLDAWSNTNAAKDALPEIVFSLARATAPDARDLRFPHGNSSRLPGFDAVIQSDAGSMYVPRGQSVWEFGTSADYKAKANADLKERSTNPRGVDPAETTFVACTSRRWVNPSYSLTEWEADAKKNYPQWKAIKFVDAVALDHWFDNAPAVAASEAYKRWVPQDGVLSLDQFWDQFSGHYDPRLTEAVALAGRTENAKELIERLKGPPGPIRLRYDSSDQVAAFVTAAIRQAPDEDRKFLEARTLVVTLDRVARFFSARRDLIFILQDEARRQSWYLTSSHVTVVPLNADSADDRVDVRPLIRPTQHEFGDALKTMMPDHEARALGLISMGSLTVLRRHRPNLQKEWPDWQGKEDLFAATLAGAWSTGRQADRDAIAELSGSASYEEYEAKIRKFVDIENAPIEQIGKMWAMQAPFDAVLANWKHFRPVDHERLRAVALKVFAERDSALSMGKDEMLTDERFPHSEWLRRGLASTLLHLSVLMSEGKMSAGWLPVKFVDGVIADIPGIATDAAVLASLRDICPLLMEAAPTPLLEALEHLLEGSGEKILPLFEDRGGWMPSGFHTGLLWGLEALAWEPDRFSDAVHVLVKLARIDPGGKLSNRPLASLSEIFLPWSPNTNASGAARASALKDICDSEPDVAWDLLKTLLPGQKGYSSPTNKPLFRESGASGRERPTRGTFARDEQVVLDLALPLLGKRGERWMALLPTLPATSEEYRAKALGLLRLTASDMSAEDRGIVWAKLREKIALQSRYPDAHMAYSQADMAKLAEIMAALQPSDDIERIKHLFDHYVPEIEDNDDDPESAEVTATKARTAAAKLVWDTRGMAGVRELIAKAPMPYRVTVALADAAEGLSDTASRLEALLTEEAISVNLLASYSAAADTKLGNVWREHVYKVATQSDIPAERRAALIVGWPPDSAIWDRVADLGDEVERNYWILLAPWGGDVKPNELGRLAENLKRVDRSAAALMILRERSKHVPADLVLELLDRAIPELNKLPDPPSHIFVHAVEKIFQSLANRTDVAKIDVGQREYRYLPLFGYGRKDFVLNELMSTDPEFYVSLLNDVFCPASGQEAEPTEDERRRGESAIKLLMSFDRLPGAKDDGSVNEGELTDWVTKVIALSKDSDRERIGEEYVGHVLAHAPIEPTDGAWPHQSVRRLIETLKSDRVENGIRIERYNTRGVVTKAIYEGGNQERTIAEEIRNWADKSVDYPRTAKMLREFARSYEADATHEDNRAEQDRRRL